MLIWDKSDGLGNHQFFHASLKPIASKSTHSNVALLTTCHFSSGSSASDEYWVNRKSTLW